MSYFCNVVAHSFKLNKWLGAWIVFFGILFCAYWGYNDGETSSSFSWIRKWIWNTFDPIFGLISLPLTFAVFYNQANQAYLNSLEKRLSVDYMYAGKTIMEVKNAYLSGESDIRAWAQQLGGNQLTGNQLSFDMAFKTVEEAKFTPSYPKPYLQYKIIMYLDEDPRKKVILENDLERQEREKDYISEEAKAKDKKNYKLFEEHYESSIISRPSATDCWSWVRIE